MQIYWEVINSLLENKYKEGGTKAYNGYHDNSFRLVRFITYNFNTSKLEFKTLSYELLGIAGKVVKFDMDMNMETLYLELEEV